MKTHEIRFDGLRHGLAVTVFFRRELDPEWPWSCRVLLPAGHGGWTFRLPKGTRPSQTVAADQVKRAEKAAKFGSPKIA